MKSNIKMILLFGLFYKKGKKGQKRTKKYLDMLLMSPPHSSRGNDPPEDSRHNHDLSHAKFKIKLTGYRLFNIVLTLVFLFVKVILSYLAEKPRAILTVGLVEVLFILP